MDPYCTRDPYETIVDLLYRTQNIGRDYQKMFNISDISDTNGIPQDEGEEFIYHNNSDDDTTKLQPTIAKILLQIQVAASLFVNPSL